MNGQVTMAEWLIENKNGKSWKKYGKERVYINIYAGDVQVANYFYDVITDKFFGCDSKTEKLIRNEFEAATENKVEKLSKELETRKSMLRTQMRVKAAKEVIEENQKRIKELEEAIKAETTTEEATNEEVTNEETTTEEATNEEVTNEEVTNEEVTNEETTTEEVTNEETTTEEATNEEVTNEETTNEEVTNEEVTNEETTNEETTNEETTNEETKKISTVDLQNFLSSKVSSAINAKVELKKIIKIIANKTQQTLQKEEVKEIATNKKISLVFQEQMLLLVFSRLEMTNKIYNLEDWTSYLLYSQDFDEMIKNIKDFIKEEKKGGD